MPKKNVWLLHRYREAPKRRAETRPEARDHVDHVDNFGIFDRSKSPGKRTMFTYVNPRNWRTGNNAFRCKWHLWLHSPDSLLFFCHCSRPEGPSLVIDWTCGQWVWTDALLFTMVSSSVHSSTISMPHSAATTLCIYKGDGPVRASAPCSGNRFYPLSLSLLSAFVNSDLL